MGGPWTLRRIITVAAVLVAVVVVARFWWARRWTYIDYDQSKLVWESRRPNRQTKPDVPLFAVRKDGKQGFINARGEVVIEIKYRKVYPFSEGLAPVTMDGDLWGYIDSQGREVIPPQFQMPGWFSEGLAPCRVQYTDPYGYINTKGEWVISPRFEFAQNFLGGVARVGESTLKGMFMGFMDAGAGNEGHIRYSYIDRDGNRVPAPTATAEEVAQLPLVRTYQDGKCGFIDVTGKLVIDLQFENTRDFTEGLAPVKIGGLWGYIDAKGAMVIPPQFAEAESLSEGLAPVRPQGEPQWGFIDRTGTMIIRPAFHHVSGGFRDGLCEVVVNRKVGYIDRDGKYVWEPQE